MQILMDLSWNNGVHTFVKDLLDDMSACLLYMRPALLEAIIGKITRATNYLEGKCAVIPELLDGVSSCTCVKETNYALL